MKIIAKIHTDFPTKFGIPRQSGLVRELQGKIVFEPEYRNPDAFRGLEGFSHIWLLWKFSESKKEHWSATVKPPRLGGKARMGVFATRSPFRPNDIGLSSVRLDKVLFTEKEGPVLMISGADLMDGTPIYDIKPYIPFVDSHPDATDGFTENTKNYLLYVNFPEKLLECIPVDKREAIVGVLAQDPRPGYDNVPERSYGVEFAGFDVRFTVSDDTLTVYEVVQKQHNTI